MSRVRIVVAALISVAACADQAPRVHSVPPCTGHVALEVGTGTTPTITWKPACAVAFLSVTMASDSLAHYPLWIIGSATFSETIAPPVVYGLTPAGAGPSFVPAEGLAIGQRYVVRLNTTMLLGVPAMDSIEFTVRQPAP